MESTSYVTVAAKAVERTVSSVSIETFKLLAIFWNMQNKKYYWTSWG